MSTVHICMFSKKSPWISVANLPELLIDSTASLAMNATIAASRPRRGAAAILCHSFSLNSIIHSYAAYIFLNKLPGPEIWHPEAFRNPLCPPIPKDQLINSSCIPPLSCLPELTESLSRTTKSCASPRHPFQGEERMELTFPVG